MTVIGALVVAAALQYQGAIMAAVHRQWGTYDRTAWIAAIGEVESRFIPNAKSHTGARGCYQFTRIAIKEVARLDPRMTRFDPWDCHQSIKAAVLLLDLYRRQFYRLSACEQHRSATMAYNRGPGTVRKLRRVYGVRWAENADREGRNYLPKVLRTERGYVVAGWKGVLACG